MRGTEFVEVPAYCTVNGRGDAFRQYKRVEEMTWPFPSAA